MLRSLIAIAVLFVPSVGHADSAVARNGMRSEGHLRSLVDDKIWFRPVDRTVVTMKISDLKVIYTGKTEPAPQRLLLDHLVIGSTEINAKIHRLRRDLGYAFVQRKGQIDFVAFPAKAKFRHLRFGSWRSQPLESATMPDETGERALKEARDFGRKTKTVTNARAVAGDYLAFGLGGDIRQEFERLKEEMEKKGSKHFGKAFRFGNVELKERDYGSGRCGVLVYDLLTKISSFESLVVNLRIQSEDSKIFGTTIGYYTAVRGRKHRDGVVILADKTKAHGAPVRAWIEMTYEGFVVAERLVGKPGQDDWWKTNQFEPVNYWNLKDGGPAELSSKTLGKSGQDTLPPK